jgi:hypothetical protein
MQKQFLNYNLLLAAFDELFRRKTEYSLIICNSKKEGGKKKFKKCLYSKYGPDKFSHASGTYVCKIVTLKCQKHTILGRS